jgi:hypothetical protein
MQLEYPLSVIRVGYAMSATCMFYFHHRLLCCSAASGLSVYLHGVAVVNGQSDGYGGLGGEPAITLH